MTEWNKIGNAESELEKRRIAANQAATNTIEMLQVRLRKVVKYLRGAPRIFQDLRGYRIAMVNHKDPLLPGKGVFVLTRECAILFVEVGVITETLHFTSTTEYQADFLESYVATLQVALAEHLQGVDRRTKKYQGVIDLATRLWSAMGT